MPAFGLNAPHLHLVLNHVPTIGAFVALGLLLMALIRRNEAVQQIGLEVLFIVAVVTLPVFVTGAAARPALKEGPAFSEFALRSHLDAAIYGFTVIELAGFAAWVALFQSSRRGRAARSIVTAATALLVVGLVIMGRAATLGGEIRHPEIVMTASTEPGEGAADATLDPNQFLATWISEYLVNSPWAWPAAETIHFLGLSLSIGILLAVNLRILGVMRQVPFADVHRLLPWGMLGFGANLITGMLFFVALPAQYISNEPFHWKIVFLVIAGANFLYLTVFRKAWAADSYDPNLAEKAMAVASIFSWLAVLYAGRMLPYLGNAF
jgi:hypothetical protein